MTRTAFEVDSPYFLDPRTNSRHFEAAFAGTSALKMSSPSSVRSFSILFHLLPTSRCSTMGMPSAAGTTLAQAVDRAHYATAASFSVGLTTTATDADCAVATPPTKRTA